MDQFKKYLQDNASGLDQDIPSNDLWEKIAADTAVKKKRPVSKRILLKYAVAACILLATITVIYQRFFTGRKELEIVSEKTIPVDQKKLKTPGDSPLNIIAPPLLATYPGINKSAPLKIAKNNVANTPETSYESLIAERARRLSSIPVLAASPGYFSVFTSQLQQMDKDEQSIKKDIRNEGYSDELMDQLIEVYQQKLNLLKRFQSEIQKINNKVKQQRPVDSSTKPYYIQL